MHINFAEVKSKEEGRVEGRRRQHEWPTALAGASVPVYADGHPAQRVCNRLMIETFFRLIGLVRPL